MSMSKHPKVCIIGSEGWGSAIATAVCKNVLTHSFDPRVHIYVYDELVRSSYLSEVINERHENIKYLPGIELPENLIAVNDLIDAAQEADILIFATQHDFVKPYCNILAGYVKSDAYAISLTKGFEHIKDGEIDLYSHTITKHLGIPCYSMMNANCAMEMAQGKLCEITLGCNNVEHAIQLSKLMKTENCMVVVVDDVDGVELCNTLKDLVALSAGFIDGLRLGENARVACLHLGLKEMMRFIKNFNPTTRVSTLIESCGLANSVASAYADKNVTFAKNFVMTRKTIQEIEANLLHGKKLLGPIIAEEIFSYLEKEDLVESYPLFSMVHKICQNEVPPEAIIETLRHHPDLNTCSVSGLQSDEFPSIAFNPIIYEDVANAAPQIGRNLVSKISADDLELDLDDGEYTPEIDSLPYAEYFESRRDEVEYPKESASSITAQPQRGTVEFSFQLGSKKDTPDVHLQIRDTMPDSGAVNEELPVVGKEYTNYNNNDCMLRPVCMSRFGNDQKDSELTSTGIGSTDRLKGKKLPSSDKYKTLKLRINAKTDKRGESRALKAEETKTKQLRQKSAENMKTKPSIQKDGPEPPATDPLKLGGYASNIRKSEDGMYEMQLFEDNPAENKLVETIRTTERDALMKKKFEASKQTDKFTKDTNNKTTKSFADSGTETVSEVEESKPEGKGPEGFKYDYKISIRSRKIPIERALKGALCGSEPTDPAIPRIGYQLSPQELWMRHDVAKRFDQASWDQLSVNEGKLETQEELPESLLMKPIKFQINAERTATTTVLNQDKKPIVESGWPHSSEEFTPEYIDARGSIVNELQTETTKAVETTCRDKSNEYDNQKNLHEHTHGKKGTATPGKGTSTYPRFTVEDFTHLRAQSNSDEKRDKKSLGAKKPLQFEFETDKYARKEYPEKQTMSKRRDADSLDRSIVEEYQRSSPSRKQKQRDFEYLEHLKAEVENTILDKHVPKYIEDQRFESSERGKDHQRNEKYDEKKFMTFAMETPRQEAGQDTMDRDKGRQVDHRVNMKSRDLNIDESEELKPEDERASRRDGDHEDQKLRQWPLTEGLERNRYLGGTQDSLPRATAEETFREIEGQKKQYKASVLSRKEDDKARPEGSSEEWEWLLKNEKFDGALKDIKQKKALETESKFGLKRYRHLLDFIGNRESAKEQAKSSDEVTSLAESEANTFAKQRMLKAKKERLQKALDAEQSYDEETPRTEWRRERESSEAQNVERPGSRAERSGELEESRQAHREQLSTSKEKRSMDAVKREVDPERSTRKEWRQESSKRSGAESDRIVEADESEHYQQEQKSDAQEIYSRKTDEQTEQASRLFDMPKPTKEWLKREISSEPDRAASRLEDLEVVDESEEFEKRKDNYSLETLKRNIEAERMQNVNAPKKNWWSTKLASKQENEVKSVESEQEKKTKSQYKRPLSGDNQPEGQLDAEATSEKMRKEKETQGKESASKTAETAELDELERYAREQRNLWHKKHAEVKKLGKKLSKLMTKGQNANPPAKEKPVDFDGLDPYVKDDRLKQLHDKLQEQMKISKAVNKPFHPPLNPRVRIPRPPFDVRDQEYHTINFRPAPVSPPRALPPQHMLRMTQSSHAGVTVSKLPRPMLKIPPFMMRSSALAIELGCVAALLSRYRGCK